MKPYLTTDAATLYHARAEEVYPRLDPGSVAMVWSDGPYAMNKAEWDRMGVDGLADWYAPHVEAWGRVCAPSATVYLWNTAEGWARIDPVMRAAGWRFRALIVWGKGHTPAQIGYASLTTWIDSTEVAGCYTRGEPCFHGTPESLTEWRMSSHEWKAERLQSDELRVRKRGCAAEVVPLHPCQKPLAFAERAVRASTRVGDTILDPFAGTNRIALACHHLPEEERRHAIGIEMDRRWLEAIRPALVADHAAGLPKGQAALFGRLT